MKAGTALLLASPGMEASVSFAHRFSILAGMPWISIYISGGPMESEALYCDTPFKLDIVRNLTRATVVSINITGGATSEWKCENQSHPEGTIAAVCEIYLKRNASAFRKLWFLFEELSGQSIGSGAADI